MTMPCHCGSRKPFADCCEPLIRGSAPAPTAEALMRARYSAYVTGAIDFLTESLHPDQRHDHDVAATRRWAEGAQWLGLELLAGAGGGPDDEEGSVEFVARYKEKGVVRRHHELSRFRRRDGRWYFIDGELVKPETRRNASRIGRNDPCSCGSGRKYKKCCGAAA